MQYDDFEYLDIEVREHIAFITLNGPERGNAFDRRGYWEMSTVWRRIAADPDVRVALVTGAGRAFSIGATAARFAEVTAGDVDVSYRSVVEMRELVHSAIDCDTPVVCAINGPINGGPLTFALTSDVIVAERQVTFRDPHVLASLTTGDGSVVTWPSAMGLIRAKRYLLTGDPISADEACELGLVTEVVDTGTSLARATEHAERLAAMPQMALRTTKRSLNQWLRSASVGPFELSLAFEQLTKMLPETRERLLALADAERGKDQSNERA